MRARGLTFVELLIAIAVIGLAFGALLSSQLTSLRASARAHLASEVKAFAEKVLVKKSFEVQKYERSFGIQLGPYTDAILGIERKYSYSFYFIDYYYRCPTLSSPPPGRSLRDVACEGREEDPEKGLVADWAIFREPGTPSGPLGIQAEGVVTVVVTARAPQGVQVTVGRRVTCYDVYPSPTHDKPPFCPEPLELPKLPIPPKPPVPPEPPKPPIPPEPPIRPPELPPGKPPWKPEPPPPVPPQSIPGPGGERP